MWNQNKDYWEAAAVLRRDMRKGNLLSGNVLDDETRQCAVRLLQQQFLALEQIEQFSEVQKQAENQPDDAFIRLWQQQLSEAYKRRFETLVSQAGVTLSGIRQAMRIADELGLEQELSISESYRCCMDILAVEDLSRDMQSMPVNELMDRTRRLITQLDGICGARLYLSLQGLLQETLLKEQRKTFMQCSFLEKVILPVLCTVSGNGQFSCKHVLNAIGTWEEKTFRKPYALAYKDNLLALVALFDVLSRLDSRYPMELCRFLQSNQKLQQYRKKLLADHQLFALYFKQPTYGRDGRGAMNPAMKEWLFGNNKFWKDDSFDA